MGVRTGDPAHRETVQAIAAALQLGAHDRANFVVSWRGGLRALQEMITGPGMAVDVAERKTTTRRHRT